MMGTMHRIELGRGGVQQRLQRGAARGRMGCFGKQGPLGRWLCAGVETVPCVWVAIAVRGSVMRVGVR